jgi:hypothetical protein
VDALTLEALIDVAGRDAFDAACAWAHTGRWGSAGGDDEIEGLPHDLADRVWFEGDESLRDRLAVATELYRLMPAYAHFIYWPVRDFDKATAAQMWDGVRSFLDDPRAAVGGPVAYWLWVDIFELNDAVEGPWREVAGPQEPRRPRLARVLRASGPVAWSVKAPLYRRLAAEGGWDDDLFEALWGSVGDVYGSLDRAAALAIFRQLRPTTDSERHGALLWALEYSRLPERGDQRRELVAKRMSSSQS